MIKWKPSKRNIDVQVFQFFFYLRQEISLRRLTYGWNKIIKKKNRRLFTVENLYSAWTKYIRKVMFNMCYISELATISLFKKKNLSIILEFVHGIIDIDQSSKFIGITTSVINNSHSINIETNAWMFVTTHRKFTDDNRRS